MPLVSAGGVQSTTICSSPGVTLTSVGASGGVPVGVLPPPEVPFGVSGAEALPTWDVPPPTRLATTLNVYCVFGSRPMMLQVVTVGSVVWQVSAAVLWPVLAALALT